MKQPSFKGVPEAQHAVMRSQQGLISVEKASDALYECFLGCLSDGNPWPSDLDRCHAMLWAHLGRDETFRRRLLQFAEPPPENSHEEAA